MYNKLSWFISLLFVLPATLLGGFNIGLILALCKDGSEIALLIVIFLWDMQLNVNVIGAELLPAFGELYGLMDNGYRGSLLYVYCQIIDITSYVVVILEIMIIIDCVYTLHPGLVY